MNIKAKIYRAFYPVFKLYLRIIRPKASGSGVIVRCENEVLLIKNTYGDARWWSFPGGGVKKGETPESAARRELQEEVGIDASRLREIGTFVFTKHYRNDTVHVFEAEVRSRDVHIDPTEIKEAKWITASEVREEDLSDVGILMWRVYADEKIFEKNK